MSSSSPIARRTWLGSGSAEVHAAPELTATFVHQALDRAISGVGRLEGAADVADRHLAQADGDESAALTTLIEAHVRLSGAQGFLTNLGGLATMAVAVPANIAGLALVQCRLVAAVVNFAPRQIGPFMSEVLTLGFPDREGEVVLIAPSGPVENGSRLF